MFGFGGSLASSYIEIKFSMFWRSFRVGYGNYKSIWEDKYLGCVGRDVVLSVVHVVSSLVTATGSDSSALHFSLGVWFANFDLQNPDTLSIGQHTFPNALSGFFNRCERRYLK